MGFPLLVEQLTFPTVSARRGAGTGEFLTLRPFVGVGGLCVWCHEILHLVTKGLWVD